MMSNDRNRTAANRAAGRLTMAIGIAAAIATGPLGLAEAQDGSLLRAAAPMQNSQRFGVSQTAGNAAPQANLAPPPGSATASPRGRGYPPASSSYGPEAVPLSGASWTFVPPQPVRSYQKNDIVTIRVDELSQMQAEGKADNRRNSLYDALLRDWITLRGLTDVRPSPQSEGDPRIQGSVNELYRADSSLQSRESLTFNIAARIVDIRPNGNLVLEGRKTYTVNDNTWGTALSGICRPTDIAPDNVVLSRDLLDIQISKQDRGSVRDGYRRGWFKRWFDTFSPF